MRRVVLFAALLAASPAAAASLLSYHMNFGDAVVHDDGRTFKVWVHPKQDLILLEPTFGEIAGAKPQKWPIEYWRGAAEAFVRPLGCGIEEVTANYRAGAAWEAKYVCPAGVDLRSLAAAQASQLKKGEPFAPPPASPAAP